MIGAAMLNDDQQEPMRFIHNDKSLAKLTVAKISGDGNCLFAAIVHQIFRMPIDSDEHKAATIKLRLDVVEYILQHFDAFKYTLQDRIYEITKKKKHEIIDMAEECKNFVRNILSQNGFWGGHECIVAASKIHSINIIVFDEQGNYYVAGDNKLNFDKTISIGYRGTVHDGKIIRCHYDSVTDISSATMYKVTSSIENGMK